MVPPAICHVSLPYMLIQISACNVLIQLVHDTNREIQQIGDEAFCSTTSIGPGVWLDLLNCWCQTKRTRVRIHKKKNTNVRTFNNLNSDKWCHVFW